MAKKRKTELDIETGAIPVPDAAAPSAEPAPSAAAPEPLEEEEGEKQKGPRKPINKKFLFIFGIAIVLIVTATLAGTLLLKVKKPPAQVKQVEGKLEKERKEETLRKRKQVVATFEPFNNLTMAPFLVPYKHDGQDGFVRVVFTLQLNDPEVIKEVGENLPLIRNSIMYTLTMHDRAELLEASKREELMRELRYNIDRSLQTGRVEAILISEMNIF